MTITYRCTICNWTEPIPENAELLTAGKGRGHHVMTYRFDGSVHPLQWVNGTIETIRHNVMASSLTCGEKLGVFGDRFRPVTDGATVCYRHSSFLYPRLPWSK